jgi:tripartite-type tricarboxylate transporter receptor subunit TctC
MRGYSVAAAVLTFGAARRSGIGEPAPPAGETIMIHRSTLAAAIAAGLSLVMSGAAAPARAQDYPSHPITMIVPLAPGGSTDTLGRIMAKAMSATLGQTVVVENTAGAAGVIGVTRAERSAPDGYTVLWGMWGTNMANGAIYNLEFDLLNDFEPVALVATQPFLIDARKTMPANNLKELIAWLKANADKATMGTSGVGSPSHVAGVLMENMLGLKWQMVSYRSAGLATQDLLAGITDIQLDTPAVSLPHVKSGDLKAYAVTAKERIAVAPDIPTTDEAGLPGYYFSFWHAMWAPKGTPKPIVAKLNAAVQTALADPDTRQKLTDLAQEIYPRDQQTPEALHAFQKAEIDKWWPIIKAAGIKAE